MNCVICILIGVGFLEKKEIIDTIVEIESKTDATLQTLSTLKDEIANLLEENQTLRMENKHLRERLEDQAVQAQENQENVRSEEHTSELQSRGQLVCRLLLEKKKR